MGNNPQKVINCLTIDIKDLVDFFNEKTDLNEKLSIDDRFDRELYGLFEYNSDIIEESKDPINNAINLKVAGDNSIQITIDDMIIWLINEGLLLETNILYKFEL